MALYITLAVLVLAAVFFVWGKIRSDIVALCALLALMLTNVLTIEEALSGFSNSIVIMMAALFIVGGGIFQTGLAKMISTRILNLAGNSDKKLFLLIMLVTALIGSFVSNTGTIALMLPIVISLAATAKTNVRRFLMPLAFASSMGGMMTLIGTPPNLIISGTLSEAGYEPLTFFSFLPVGLITLTVGIVVLWPMSKMLVSSGEDNKSKDSNDESLNELSQKYQIAQNLYRAQVAANSPLKDKVLKDLDITSRFNVAIAEIRRDRQHRFHKTVNMDMAGPDSKIKENDILYILGNEESIEFFVKENRLHLIDACHTESKALSVSEAGGMEFSELGIAELVLMSNSKIINKKVSDSGFRNLFNVNILGIQRKREYILKDIKDERMQAGDVLLIQGKWDDIKKLDEMEGDEWVVVGQPEKEAAKVPLTPKAPIAGFIMIAMVIAMVFNWLPPVTSVLIAAVLMILTGCLRNVEAAYKTINWESIVLFAGMIPLSIAMEKTGASSLISESIVSQLGGFGPRAVLAGIYLATSFLTLFLSNTATAVLFAPIALQAAISLDINPMAFLFAVAVGASMCFASPFSTPPNALVMSAGRYSFMDYVKIGLPLQLLYAIIMIIVLPLLFPF
ncbi:SLC13 family permease [Bacteroidales bacterium OttesenSCG-928-A17]|nr:SLC13 family permease [Bacteroidales bacterium OttesenSCG-928-A17]